MNLIKLDGKWKLEAVNPKKNDFSIKKGSTFEIALPGSVQDGLIENNVILDPYFSDNELKDIFVGQSDWNISRKINIEKKDCRYVLKLEKLDTVASLYVNSKKVESFDNEHRIYYVDITKYLVNGDNDFCFKFTSSEKLAVKRNSELAYPIPCSRYRYDSPNRNLVRKAQCNAAWDWGLCLLTMGIYESLELYECENFCFKDFSAVPSFKDKKWKLDIQAYLEAFEDCSSSVLLEVASKKQNKVVKLSKGENIVKFSLDFEENEIEKWWPNGYGNQKLYSVCLSFDSWKKTRKIGFRTIEVKNKKTMGGKELTVCVNGKDVFCKGANWIPLDARPLRQTAERFDKIIKDVRDANMNMLRLWGGGWYEKEEFYDACDKYGILIWHDLMFSCSVYPTDQWFLDSVKYELTDQIRRLKSRTSIALWCGNNECLGALTWYEETLADMPKYLKDYEKLYTNWIDEIIRKEDPKRMYWPSSPCAGPGDYSDNWHSDGNGDMHFWTVWHERKDFEVYQTVRPRFCSEFGYQSFPSLSEAKSFLKEGEFNLTSRDMDHHQRNDAGNSIIIEMFTRYFKMPYGFANQLYLSQIQQALAIETAVTYWRSLMPYCMGTLFWQLNDVWPVSSWSSVEYSGKWKPLMYAAKRFYSSIAPLAYIKDDELVVCVANDSPDNKTLSCDISLLSFDGKTIWKKSKSVKSVSLGVQTVLKQKLKDIDREKSFVVVSANSVEKTLLLTRPKYAEIKNPGLEISDISKKDGCFCINLNSKNPAFFTVLDCNDIKGKFEDNDFTVIGKKSVMFKPEEDIELEYFKKNLKVYDLFSSFQEK